MNHKVVEHKYSTRVQTFVKTILKMMQSACAKSYKGCMDDRASRGQVGVFSTGGTLDNDDFSCSDSKMAIIIIFNIPSVV